MIATAKISTRLLAGFDDPTFGPDDWARVLATGQSDVVFLTWHYQRAWWQAFHRGRLLLIAAERDGEVVALAPLFADCGMVYFVGSGGSDYLDFIGDIADPEVLDALLTEARLRVPGFIGFVFYHVPENSQTGWRLRQAAERLGLKIFDEGSQIAPALEMGAEHENGRNAATRRSLLRHERFFLRDGRLQARHFTRGEQILPELDEFFAQHVGRWAATGQPSLFHDELQRTFYRNLAGAAADGRCRGGNGMSADWLRFTRLQWGDRPIAFHFGFCYRGNFLWYKPSFAIELAPRSPGEVLLRKLLLQAMAEGAHTFDFGLGDEMFKARFATHINLVRNWGLYDPRALAAK